MTCSEIIPIVLNCVVILPSTTLVYELDIESGNGVSVWDQDRILCLCSISSSLVRYIIRVYCYLIMRGTFLYTHMSVEMAFKAYSLCVYRLLVVFIQLVSRIALQILTIYIRPFYPWPTIKLKVYTLLLLATSPEVRIVDRSLGNINCSSGENCSKLSAGNKIPVVPPAQVN